MRELAGLTAVVTGGASGLGAAIAERLAAGGARVAVFDLDVLGAPPGTLAVHTDVTDDDSVRAAVARVLDEWGRLVVVNKAGVGAQGTVADNPSTAPPPRPDRRVQQCRAVFVLHRARGAPAGVRGLDHCPGVRPLPQPVSLPPVSTSGCRAPASSSASSRSSATSTAPSATGREQHQRVPFCQA